LLDDKGFHDESVFRAEYVQFHLGITPPHLLVEEAVPEGPCFLPHGCSIDRLAIEPLVYANSCGCAIVRMCSVLGNHVSGMSQRSFQVGQRVDRWCAVCAEERGHVVISVSVKGRVTRVKCSICGTRATFKNSAIVPVISRVPGDAKPCHREHPYQVKQSINHPTYGIGEVIALFADRVRRSIHARA
jgi:hypothetical protein